MRRLILLRHAKSSWAEPDLEDHDRPLSRRGRLAAALMGAWLADRDERPDLVLLSTSARTRETWERMRPLLPDAPEAEARPDFYHADPATLLEAVRAAPDEAGTALLIGHQPGLGAFARQLSRPEPPAHCAPAFTRWPTAGCAILDFEGGRWAEAAFGAAAFHSFAAPKHLV